MADNEEINWTKILNKFSSYEGTIVSFCNKNNIKPHQLYYHRKKIDSPNTPVLHGIKVNKEDLNKPAQITSTVPTTHNNTDIRIEIGQAKIYISSDDILALGNIIKMVSTTC